MVQNKYLEKIAGFFDHRTRQDKILDEMKNSSHVYLFHGSHVQDHLKNEGMFLDKAMEITSDKLMYDKFKGTGRMEPHFNLTSIKDYGKLYTLDRSIPHWSEGKKDPLLVRVDSSKLRLNEGNVRFLNLVFGVPENDEWWYHGNIDKDDIIHPDSPEYSKIIAKNKYLRG